jgi:hypothetical protein
METGSLIILLIIVALGAAWLALPFLRGRADSAALDAGKRQALVNDYARVVAALRDLEEDHTTGKMSDDAYTAEKARLTEQGVVLLETLDKEGLLPAARQAGSPPDKGSPPGKASAADQALDEALEAAIARYASAKAKG